MRSFFVILLVLSCSLALTNASVLGFNKAPREDSSQPTNSTTPFPPVYKCTFDSSDCSLKVDHRDIFFLTRASQVSTNLTFTDISSIMNPTTNGQTCQIPYMDNGVEYYHCKPQNGEEQCMTSMGFSTCSGAGRFVLAKFNKTSSTSQSKSQLIIYDLLNNQPYRLSLYTFMYGLGVDNDCQNTTDYIAISILNNNDGLGTAAYRLKDFGPNGQWKKISFDFQKTSGSLTVNFHVGSYGYSKCQVYFGFDQIEIAPTTTGSNSASQIANGLVPVLLLSLILSHLLN